MGRHEDDLLTQADIAREYGVSRQVVHHWSTRRPDFPKPVDQRAARRRYTRGSVDRWVSSNPSLKVTRSAPPLSRTIASLGLDDEAASFLARIVLPGLSVIPTDDLRAAADAGSVRQVLTDRVLAACEEVGVSDEEALSLRRRLSKISESDLADMAMAVVSADGMRIPSLIESMLRSPGSGRQLMTAIESRAVLRAVARPAGRIADPCCRSGVLVMECAIDAEDFGRGAEVFASDTNPTQAVAARLHLDAANVAGVVSIHHAHAEAPFPGMTFDTIVMDVLRQRPESSTGPTDPETRPDEATYAWLMWAQAHLAAGGRGCVLTPARFLESSLSSRRAIDSLLEFGALEALVLLPSSDPTIETSSVLWVLRNGHGERATETVAVVDASGIASTWRERPVEAAIDVARVVERVVSGFSEFDGSVTGVTVSTARLANTEGPVRIKNVIARAERQDAARVQQRLSAATRLAGDLQEGVATFEFDPALLVPSAPDGYAPLTDVCRVFSGVRLGRAHPMGPSSDIPFIDSGIDSGIPVIQFHRLSDWTEDDCPKVAERRTRALLTKPGDVVLRADGDVAAVVDWEGGHYIEAPLVGLRLHPDEQRTSPDLLAEWLNSTEVRGLAAGTKVKRLRVEDIEVPLFPSGIVTGLSRQIRELRIHAVAARALAAAYDQIRGLALSQALGPEDGRQPGGLMPRPDK